MPGRYRIEADIVIGTEIEPEGSIGGVEDAEHVLDYEDSSSWNREDVRAEGGSVSIEIEASSEEDARDRGNMILDGMYWSSSDGFEWEIEDYSISNIDCIEEPWDMERALTVIRAFLTRMREMGGVNAEEEEAFRFFLDEITP